jgi:hypothetical protein
MHYITYLKPINNICLLFSWNKLYKEIKIFIIFRSFLVSYNCSFSVSGFKSVGCWRDTWDRAIPSLEGKNPILDEPDYKARTNALIKCAKAAKDLKMKMFAVQNGGQCFGGKDADRTFMKYGVSKTCRGKNFIYSVSNKMY